jgi:membrane protease YdiL (CAAX protease family)
VNDAVGSATCLEAPARAEPGTTVAVPLVGYGLAFAAAQAAASHGEVLLGSGICAALALILPSHAVRAHHRGDAAAGIAYACLGLVPALVLVRHVLDVGAGATTGQHLLWAAVAALAAGLALLAAGGTDHRAFTRGDWRVGAPAIVLAPAVGLATYGIARAGAETVFAAVTPIALLLIAVAVGAEELLFRGSLQRTLTRAAGRAAGTTLTILFFTLAYLDVTPHGYAGAVGAAGVLLSLAVAAAAPLVAVVAARIVVTVTALSLWPHLLG